MAVVMYFVFEPYFNGFETLMESFNSALIFMGLAISFSTLQDTTKTQNKISKKVWQSPKKGKITLACMAVMALYCIISGIVGFYSSEMEVLQQFSFGLIVLGIGILGLLKAAMEMFENHRLDKSPPLQKELEEVL